MSEKIKISLTGRIPKYFFASLKKEFRDELPIALELSNGEIKTEEEFLKLVFEMCLEFFHDAREKITNIFTDDKLEKIPNFSKLINQIIYEDWGHLLLINYGDIFEFPEYNKGMLTIFKGDSIIKISKNSEDLIKGKILKSFADTPQHWFSDDESEPSYQNMQSLIESNLHDLGESDDFCWGKNEFGNYFLRGWFSPESYSDFIKNTRINDEYVGDGQLSIFFDDIATYDFEFETEKFDPSKLVFVNWQNCQQFRYDAWCCEFINIYYDGMKIQPVENWHTDLGIHLSYEDETLENLLNN